MRAFVLASLVGAAVMFASGNSSALAQVESGPEEGKPAPALKVADVTGYNAGKELDYVEDRKDAPTLYVLIPAEGWTRPMARLLKVLDEEVGKIDGAYQVAVWLTGDKEKTKQYLPVADNALSLRKTALTYFPGDATQGPENWGYNDLAFFTAVVVKDGKVVKNFGLKSVNETDAPKIIEALK